jgi:hypothetical protein
MGAIVIRTRYDEGTKSAEVATSEDWRYIRVGKLLVFIDFNKKYNHSALRFCVFLYITEWPWPNFIYTHTTRILTMRKTCHKNNKRKKKLTLLNEIYWRKITYLYVRLSTKISICIYQLYLTIFESSFFLNHNHGRLI